MDGGRPALAGMDHPSGGIARDVLGVSALLVGGAPWLHGDHERAVVVANDVHGDCLPPPPGLDPYSLGMAKLIYASNMSLDGCTEDDRGGFDWAPPDDDVFAFTTGLMRLAGTYLYGRRMYETMAVWETDASLATQSTLRGDFAVAWQAADKVVYSTTLTGVPTTKTRLEHHFDPAAVRDLKAAAGGDLLVGGPHLAAQAFEAGLVDECHLLVWPVVLGGTNPALPAGMRVELELLDERRFGNGVVYLRYRTGSFQRFA